MLARGPARFDHRQEGAGGRATAGLKLQNLIGRRVNLKIEEIGRRPEMRRSAGGGRDWSSSCQKRASFRRTMKRAMETNSMDAGAKGIKVQLAGRLGGAEMARREKADIRLDSVEHAAGQDRLRFYRSEDGSGAHRNSGLD